jgi:hypothetical protein
LNKPNKKVMKKSTITFLALLNIGTAVMTQTRYDNTIVIENFDKNHFSKIESLLIHNFYEVERFDTATYRFNTKPKPIEGSIYANDLKVSLHGFILNNDLILYANYSFRSGIEATETYSGRARYTRKQNGGSTISFNEMNRVFKQFDEKLTYREMN